ncbi:MAG: TonB-dependent receptor [Gammaproteobacteria bacterium]
MSIAISQVSRLSLVVTGLGVLVTDPAFSQVEEIVITARKREENLQEVPLSVTAIAAEQIERLGIRELQDITRYTPGVNLDSGFGLNDQRLVIRGLSPSRGRPNSAILVDGIDLTTESVSTAGGSILFNQRLLDMQQVEVVKGPQSAMYGRAAFTGAISYVTRDPGDELEGQVGVDLGEYGRRYVRMAVGGPITETFGLRVSGLGWNEDGYYNEGFTGADLGGGNGAGISLVGKWEPGDRFAARLRVAYSDDEYDQQATLYNPINTFVSPPDSANGIGSVTPDTVVGLFSGIPDDVNGRTPYLTPNPGRGTDPADLPAPEDREAYEGGFAEVINTSLKLDWDIGAGTITSYTGYANADTGQAFDGDFDVRPNADLTADIARGGTAVNFVTDTRLLSQEIRYSSNLDGPVQFTVGALYWDENVNQNETGVSVLAIPPWPGTTPENYFNTIAPQAVLIPNIITRDTNSRSVYGMLDWDFAAQWRLSIEARYAREEMEVSGTGCDRSSITGFFLCDFSTPDIVFPLGGGVFGHLARVTTVDSKTDYYVAPKASIEWSATEDLMTYLSLSRGIKPGGITTVGSGAFLDQQPDGTLDEAKFDAETLTALEIGIKSSWLERRLIVNGAVFYQEYDDKQVPVQAQVGGFLATNIENAGQAEVLGLELETIWLMTDNLRLQVGYSYLDGEFTDLVYTTNSANSIARAGNCAPDPVENVCEIDLSNNTMEDVPKHSVVATLGYYPPLGSAGFSGLLEADVQYDDERFIDEFNDRKIDSYSLINLRAGLQADNWDLLLYVNNVFDDDTIRSWSAATGLVATSEKNLIDPNLSIFPAEGFSIAPPPRHWGMRANFRF